MALTHIDLTVTGATQLSTTRKGIRHMWIENTTATGIVYVGNSSSVSSTVFGRSLAASGGTMEVGPFSGDAPCYTTEFWFKPAVDGTVIHILLVTH